MSLYNIAILSFFLICAESTDLAAVYKHGIILLKNADTSLSTTLNVDQLWLNISKQLPYPVGLAHDHVSGDLFVAELKNDHTDVFSLNLNQDDIAAVKAEVSKLGRSKIESISYDSELQRLFWTDSLKHGIYYAEIDPTMSSDYDDGVYPSIFHDDVIKPRGIAIDFCSRVLYWTERDPDKRVVRKFNLLDNSIHTVKEMWGGAYFQGITYDASTGNIIWAETSSDDVKNSSCSIIVRNGTVSQETLVTLDNCHPFSITSDENYIYWSDWARMGLMRLSKTNVSDFVKLVDTPETVSEEGTHFAFGLVNLNKLNYDDICKGRYNGENLNNEVISKENNNMGDTKSDVEIIDNELISTATSEEINTVWGPVFSSASHVNMSSRTYNHLHFIIIALAVVCLFFMMTTLLLLNYSVTVNQRSFAGVRGLFSNVKMPVISNDTVCPPKPKVPKRFGSKSRKANSKSSSCQSNDGVSIEIEDCCQMTLCDRPCYTSMSKEGRSYIGSSGATRWDDKKRLLDDSEFA